jgi:hypothetical protein
LFDDLEAQPPPAESAGEPGKPWYRRWWAITLGGLLTLFVVAGIFGDDTKPRPLMSRPPRPPQGHPSPSRPSRPPRPRRQRQPRPHRRQPLRRRLHRLHRLHHRPSRSLYHRPSRSRQMNATRHTTRASPSPATSTAKAGVETARSTPEESGSSGRMNTTWIATATASAANSRNAAEALRCLSRAPRTARAPRRVEPGDHANMCSTLVSCPVAASRTPIASWSPGCLAPRSGSHGSLGGRYVRSLVAG